MTFRSAASARRRGAAVRTTLRRCGRGHRPIGPRSARATGTGRLVLGASGRSANRRKSRRCRRRAPAHSGPATRRDAARGATSRARCSRGRRRKLRATTGSSASFRRGPRGRAEGVRSAPAHLPAAPRGDVPPASPPPIRVSIERVEMRATLGRRRRRRRRRLRRLYGSRGSRSRTSFAPEITGAIHEQSPRGVGGDGSLLELLNTMGEETARGPDGRQSELCAARPGGQRVREAERLPLPSRHERGTRQLGSAVPRLQRPDGPPAGVRAHPAVPRLGLRRLLRPTRRPAHPRPRSPDPRRHAPSDPRARFAKAITAWATKWKPIASPTSPKRSRAFGSRAVPLSDEDMSKLWSGFNTSHRLSVVYEASAVLVERKRPTRAGPPVRRALVHTLRCGARRSRRYRHSSLGPPTESASRAETSVRRRAAAVPRRPIRAAVQRTRWATSHRRGPPSGPAAGADASPVMHEVMLGDPASAHAGFESNTAVVTVIPEVLTAPAAPGSPAKLPPPPPAPLPGQAMPSGAFEVAPGAEFKLTIKPSVGRDQRLALLLTPLDPAKRGETGTRVIDFPRRPATDPETSPTAKFRVPAGFPAGNYLIQVRIDDAESDLEPETDPARAAVNPSAGPWIGWSSGPRGATTWIELNAGALAADCLRVRTALASVAEPALADGELPATAARGTRGDRPRGRAFGLSAFERDVLVLCSAASSGRRGTPPVRGDSRVRAARIRHSRSRWRRCRSRTGARSCLRRHCGAGGWSSSAGASADRGAARDRRTDPAPPPRDRVRGRACRVVHGGRRRRGRASSVARRAGGPARAARCRPGGAEPLAILTGGERATRRDVAAAACAARARSVGNRRRGPARRSGRPRLHAPAVRARVGADRVCLPRRV